MPFVNMVCVPKSIFISLGLFEYQLGELPQSPSHPELLESKTLDNTWWKSQPPNVRRSVLEIIKGNYLKVGINVAWTCRVADFMKIQVLRCSIFCQKWKIFQLSEISFRNPNFLTEERIISSVNFPTFSPKTPPYSEKFNFSGNFPNF